MAKFSNPVSFTSHFGIDPAKMEKLGVFNPLLNLDTRLFVDPLLLGKSQHPEFNQQAVRNYRRYLGQLVTLLRSSSQKDDLPWREARRRMHFPEVKGTCLGYGSQSIHGRAFGPQLREKVLQTAKQIVDLGVNDPALFLLLPLLEENVGPDLIGDMTTTIILPSLAAFTQRIASKFSVPCEPISVMGTTYRLPTNPCVKRPTPVLLVAKDILSRLPVATDWSEVCDVVSKNDAIRRKVNQHIGRIWKTKARRDKAAMRAATLRSKRAVEALLEAVQALDSTQYDFTNDPSGLVAWRWVQEEIADKFPLRLKKEAKLDLRKVARVCKTIIQQFHFLIEKKGLAKLLWRPDGKPHHEKVSQMLFFAVAHSYGHANDLDITPEADTGAGPVDFKFSSGYHERVLVEVKLSTNKKLVAGYEKQLETYREAEIPMHAVYLVIDVGQMGKKDKKLFEVRNKMRRQGHPISEIVFVDGNMKPSASKL